MIVSALDRMGSAWRLVRDNPGRGLRVLCYHTVIERWTDKRVQWPVSVTLDAFRRQVDYLAARYDVVGLSDIPEVIRRGPAARDRAVALTFDDGYASNYELAWPLLKERGLPMTVFLTTGYLSGDRRLPTYIVRCAVYHTRARRLRLSDPAREWPLDDDSLRERCVDELSGLIRRSDRAGVERLLREVRALLSDDEWREWDALYDSDRLMTWEQAESFHREGGTLGSHTDSHVMMSRCGGPDEVDAELRRSRELLEQHGIPCAGFAYPNGKRADLGKYTAHRLMRLGYPMAFTTMPGRINSLRDRYHWPRLSGQHETIEPLSAAMEADWRTLLRRELGRWYGQTHPQPLRGGEPESYRGG